MHRIERMEKKKEKRKCVVFGGGQTRVIYVGRWRRRQAVAEGRWASYSFHPHIIILVCTNP